MIQMLAARAEPEQGGLRAAMMLSLPVPVNRRGPGWERG
jgi:hypothetical protein